MVNSKRPGQDWYDTEGNLIEAHGGYIHYENDTFYWYGENKEFTDGVKDIWTWGVKCYSSKDLYNWKYEGYLIEADTENKESMVHPSRRLDRPHIVFNKKTNKYVC